MKYNTLFVLSPETSGSNPKIASTDKSIMGKASVSSPLIMNKLIIV